MQYEWKCQSCGYVCTVQRALINRDISPDSTEGRHPMEDGGTHDVRWKRVITKPTAVPFRGLADKGVFMDQHGNYPPRSMD